MSVQRKKIWVQSRRIDQKDLGDGTDEQVALGPIKEVYFQTCDSADHIKQQLRNALKIKDDTLILKVRNHRGSLIVVSSKLATNSKTVPYLVEVTKPHQTVIAKSCTVSRTKHIEALKTTLRHLVARLDKLEFESQNINEKRDERITQAMTDIDQTLDFLTKRIGVAETTKWQGMFKKNPLW